jgi:polyphosphate kinase
LATGNYNPTTGRLYTDLSLLTCRPDLGEDVTNFFNLLTGICQFQPMRKLLVAPFQLHQRLLELIHRETDNASQGLPARIVAKINSLAEREIIKALYRASQAGVQIELVVRGICCLRPGIKGLSENITVRSIVDRFLEHSRVYYFENACQPQVFIGSADWLPRNFFRRIELIVPIEDGVLRERIIHEILALPLQDNTKARLLRDDGSYQFVSSARGEKEHRSQFEFAEHALGKEDLAAKQVDGKAKYPQVKLAPSPFSSQGLSG